MERHGDVWDKMLTVFFYVWFILSTFVMFIIYRDIYF